MEDDAGEQGLALQQLFPYKSSYFFKNSDCHKISFWWGPQTWPFWYFGHAFSISGICYVIAHNFMKSRSCDGLAAKDLLKSFSGSRRSLPIPSPSFRQFFFFFLSTEPSGLSVTGACRGLGAWGLWLGCGLGRSVVCSSALGMWLQLQLLGFVGTFPPLATLFYLFIYLGVN